MPSWRQNLLACALIVGSGFAVNHLRSPLNAAFLNTKNRDDVFALPPPGQAAAMSLGYRSALADLIFAHVLVSSGIHFQEKRSFEFVGKYLELVNALDPKFEAPYLMADSLITLQAKPVSSDAYRQARRILERGLVELPFSTDLWTTAGQFFAYLGPTGGIEGKELQDWKLAGGRTLARACELASSKEAPSHGCIAAAGLLSKGGASEASQQFMNRMLAMNDDPKVLQFMSALLKKNVGSADHDRVQAHRTAFNQAWSSDLPFVSRGALLALGPSWDSAACAGSRAECSTSWRAWSAAVEERQGAIIAFNTPLSASQ